MESKILAIAVNTFRESMRERGLLAVLIYLILLPVVALAGGYVAVGQERKILIDVGLALLTLLGLILGVYWGTGMVRVEIDRRVLNFLLAKPLQRWQLIAGKFLGLALTQLVATGLMALAL
ncbi:MAG: ABC transporter permease subunit, partial [Acidobacteriota bacterium]